MIPRSLSGRFWPRSLQGQVLLSVALALLLAQAIGAILLLRAQNERREAMLVHTAALRVFAALREETGLPPPRHMRHFPPDPLEAPPGLPQERVRANPIQSGERRLIGAERELRAMLEGQGLALAEVQVFQRQLADDLVARRWIERRRELIGQSLRTKPRRLVMAAVQRERGGEWTIVRVLAPPADGRPLAGVIFQTVLIYAVLFGAIALILRRITRPLKALTSRLNRFAETRDREEQLEPEGPEDIRDLIVAHNAMEDRVGALLDEKDVMLGAIGHDLKTPLAALRVRIESVEDEAERARMAATIEDIARSLDDILSLARVGRPSDPREAVELSALVGAITEEYEDMGKPVSLVASERLVVPVRVTWLRRAIRNLADNALRYGKVARITLAREPGAALIRVEDDGPGIADDQIERMLEPFTRGDPSRNSGTGGAGLGLTLARAIADQHGGSLELANRSDADGKVAGLTATLRLPL